MDIILALNFEELAETGGVRFHGAHYKGVSCRGDQRWEAVWVGCWGVTGYA